MAYRNKKDTEKTLELVLWLLLEIPMAIIAVFKLIFTGSVKSRNRLAARLEDVKLEEIDQMDGFSFEYYIAELLKEHGFRQVVVTGGSGDFGVDITAVIGNTKYAFQCKNYQSNLGVTPIQEVYSGAPMYKASVCVVVTNAYFTPHAIELARSLGVRLWDRDVLYRLMGQG